MLLSLLKFSPCFYSYITSVGSLSEMMSASKQISEHTEKTKEDALPQAESFGLLMMISSQ